MKTRSGWNDELRDPVGIALRMQDAGASAFTLHARTRTQMFSGPADWDEIARVVEALDIPVIGNGDIGTRGGRRSACSDHTALRRHHDRAGSVRQSLALPRRAGAAGRRAPARRARTPASDSRWRWSTPDWRFGSRATPARP